MMLFLFISHQSTVEKLQKTRSENEDVKTNLANLIEEKKYMQVKMKQLEKDNSLLESSRLDLEDQVNIFQQTVIQTTQVKVM